MKDMELLQYVHETAAMGVLGLQDLLPQAESSGMRQSLRSQIREYQDIAHSSAQLLQAKGAQPKDPGLMARLSDACKEPYVTYLMAHSRLTFQEAEAIFTFQMNGCLAINRLMLRNHCEDWKAIQRTIDGFIKAGLEHYLLPDRA